LGCVAKDLKSCMYRGYSTTLHGVHAKSTRHSSSNGAAAATFSCYTYKAAVLSEFGWKLDNLSSLLCIQENHHCWLIGEHNVRSHHDLTRSLGCWPDDPRLGAAEHRKNNMCPLPGFVTSHLRNHRKSVDPLEEGENQYVRHAYCRPRS
jgi:hypothetical protein